MLAEGSLNLQTGDSSLLGAQFVDVQGDLSDKNHRFRFMLPSAEAFAAAMSGFGVGEGTRVVLYSTANPWWANRVWWMLRVFGFDKVRYRGIAKNHHRLCANFALINLYLHRKRLAVLGA